MQEITIKPITEQSIHVGKKVVYCDENSNWISVSKLSKTESKAFNRYKNDILNKNYTSLPIKTYAVWDLNPTVKKGKEAFKQKTLV